MTPKHPDPPMEIPLEEQSILEWKMPAWWRTSTVQCDPTGVLNEANDIDCVENRPNKYLRTSPRGRRVIRKFTGINEWRS